jgi:hypothetical protein
MTTRLFNGPICLVRNWFVDLNDGTQARSAGERPGHTNVDQHLLRSPLLAANDIIPNQVGGGVSPQLKTDILFLYSSEFSQSDILAFCKCKFKLTDGAKIKKIGSWDELVATIKNRAPIGRLILDFHGGTGGEIKVGDNGDEVGGSRVKKRFSTRCEKIQTSGDHCKEDAIIGMHFCLKHRPQAPQPWFGPQIQEIQFESCVVGQSPDQLVSFGRLFHATKVSGYTWWHVLSLLSASFAQGKTEKEIDESLNRFRKYLSEGNPSAKEIAEQCKSGPVATKFLLEWLVNEGADPPNLPPIFGGKWRTGNPEHFKPVKDLIKRPISSGEAQSLLNEYAKLGPGISAQYVTVTITY